MEIDESFLLENFPQCNPSDLSFVDFDDTADLADLNFDGILDDLDIDLYLNDPPLNPIDSKPNSPNSNATNSSNTESPKSNNSNNNNKRKIDDADNHRPSNSNPNIDEKRKARLVRNRESAQLSRQKKKQYVEGLEQKVKNLTFTVSDLHGKLSYYMAENVRLRSLVNGNAGNGSNHDSVHPTTPLPPMPYHYPLMPYVPYMKPNSIPIPRLNKEQSKRSERKRKKLASVSAMGLFLLAMLVIGGVTNFGISENREIDGGGGKVFDIKGHDPGLMNSFNSSNNRKDKTVEFGNVDKMYSEVTGELGDKPSEGLPALLYVPRNGKHVEINGNLIIQSVLASERAVTNESLGLNEKSWAIANPMGSSLALSNSNSRGPKGCGNINDNMKALPSGSNGVYRDDIKSTLADKYLQQWFLEGLAGPGLSSATCTEVFQLDVSPSSTLGASTMIPASSVLNNVTNKLPPSSSIKSRRMGQPIPLNGKTPSNKTRQLEKPLAASNTAFSGKTSSSSIVVSVLFDPREASDVDRDGIVSSKSLTRIFVVLLVDSVKYITYSCMLPLKSPVTRVVN